jgi:hypothetical protein
MGAKLTPALVRLFLDIENTGGTALHAGGAAHAFLLTRPCPLCRRHAVLRQVRCAAYSIRTSRTQHPFLSPRFLWLEHA